MATAIEGWQSTQRQRRDGAVESVQTVRVERPVAAWSRAGALMLGRRYWECVRRATGGLVRVREEAGTTELRVLGRAPLLLSFAAPEVTVEARRIECRYPITGGLLARAPVGAIAMAQEASDGNVEVCSRVSGFYPRLAARPGQPHWTGALYAHVQARIHVAISRRYFARLVGASG